MRAITVAGTIFLSTLAPTAFAASGAPSVEAAKEAEPPRAAWIASDATWIAHIDLEALRKSAFSSLLNDPTVSEELSEKEREQWEKVQPLLDDLTGVTLYGSGADESEPGLILQTLSDPEELLAPLNDESTSHVIVEAEGHRLHHWEFDDEAVYAFIHQSRPGGRHLLVVGEHLTDVTRGADVLTGKAQSLADVADAAISAEPAPGAFLFFTATRFDKIADHPRASAFAESARALRMDIGQRGDDAFVTAVLTTDSEQNARGITDVLRGLMGVARLAVSGEEDAQDVLALLDAIRLTSEGDTVTLSITHNAAEIARELEEHRTVRRPGESEVEVEVTVD